MGRIYYIMGKSATGKDTIYRELLKRCPNLKTIVPYTTRPIREGEVDGVQYHFRTVAQLEEIKKSGKIIELRMYQTVMGPWYYFTLDDGQFDLDQACLMIGTLESYENMCKYFGSEALTPIYIEAPDGIRLRRYLDRENAEKHPNYREVCRRYLADEDDFSEETLKRLGITTRYQNVDLDTCLDEIVQAVTG